MHAAVELAALVGVAQIDAALVVADEEHSTQTGTSAWATLGRPEEPR